jgi:hypothetical protein
MIAGLLAHPFRDTGLVWTSNGGAVWEATFNALRIGGYGLRGDVCGRIWFGNTVRVEPFGEEPLTEAGARAWIEATFREWMKLAVAWSEAFDEENRPHVCGGCYAVAEPCAPDCSDAAMEADSEDERDDENGPESINGGDPYDDGLVVG